MVLNKPTVEIQWVYSLLVVAFIFSRYKLKSEVEALVELCKSWPYEDFSKVLWVLIKNLSNAFIGSRSSNKISFDSAILSL